MIQLKIEAATRLKAISVLASGGPNFLKIVSILEKALGGEADTKSSDPSPWATLTLSKSITLTNLYKALVSAGFTKEGVGSGKGGFRAIFLSRGGKLPFTIGAYTSGSELIITGPLRPKFVKPLTDIPAKSMLADVAFFDKLCSCKFKAGVSRKTGDPALQYEGKGDRAAIETALDQKLESLEPSKLFRNVQPTSDGRVWFSKDHGCVVRVERAGVNRVWINIS